MFKRQYSKLLLALVFFSNTSLVMAASASEDSNRGKRAEIVKVATYAKPSSSSAGAASAGSAPSATSAKTFVADSNHADWKTQSGPFSCSLTHSIAGFGSVAFLRKAGAGEIFYLAAQAPVVFPRGTAVMETLPPVWRGDQAPIHLGSTVAVSGAQPVKLSANDFAPLLQQLASGSKVMFTSAVDSGQQNASPGIVRVVIDPKNFAANYKIYQKCIGEMIPYTFAQVSHISFNYPEKSEGLAIASKAELSKVARYVKVDPKVIGILVDAHSDNKGTPEENEAKSKQQSDWVNEYLVGQGVASDLIKARWHGDKFPVGNNKTDAGRGQNRRVTVRLESEETRRASEERALAKSMEEENKSASSKAEEKNQESAKSQLQVAQPKQQAKTERKPIVTVPPRETVPARESQSSSSQGKITPEQLSKMINGLELIPK